MEITRTVCAVAAVSLNLIVITHIIGWGKPRFKALF
jgi:hypothetical protein